MYRVTKINVYVYIVSCVEEMYLYIYIYIYINNIYIYPYICIDMNSNTCMYVYIAELCIYAKPPQASIPGPEASVKTPEQHQ